jgi:hypothetical protein
MSRTSGHPDAQDGTGTRDEQATQDGNAVPPFPQHGNAVTPSSVTTTILNQLANDLLAMADHDCLEAMLSDPYPVQPQGSSSA